MLAAYGDLAARTGFDFVAVPRQVHGCDVASVGRAAGAGEGARVLLPGRLDGIVTADAGVLVASTAADCVPVYLMDPASRLVGLVHAGWRGVAGGILSRGIEALEELGAGRVRIRAHFGPAICGACYEVDRPVLERFGCAEATARLDLRGALASQALDAGLNDAYVTVSTHCTSCGDVDLHSHRASGGKAGRMAAFTGFRGGF